MPFWWKKAQENKPISSEILKELMERVTNLEIKHRKIEAEQEILDHKIISMRSRITQLKTQPEDEEPKGLNSMFPKIGI